MLDPKQRQRFLRDNRARLGIGIVLVMALAALLAPLIARQSPIAIDLFHILQRPSARHWLGTDIQGRDIWSRLVFGARVSLTVGLISQGIALTLGVTMGLLAGFYGKWIDEIVMRLADVRVRHCSSEGWKMCIRRCDASALPSAPKVGKASKDRDNGWKYC